MFDRAFWVYSDSGSHIKLVPLSDLPGILIQPDLPVLPELLRFLLLVSDTYAVMATMRFSYSPEN